MRNAGFRTTLLVAALTLGCTAPARGLTQVEEAGFAVLATAVNIFYVPAKLALAAAAIPVGGLAGALSGGDTRTAYAIWVPAMGGTYFITNGHLDGSKPIEFLGYDYEDKPLPDHGGHRDSKVSAPAGARGIRSRTFLPRTIRKPASKAHASRRSSGNHPWHMRCSI